MTTALKKLRESVRQLVQGEKPGTVVHQTLDLLESELSFDQVRDALRKAIRVEQVDGQPYRWRWIQDVYDAFFIYRDDVGEETKLQKATYSMNADGIATIGAPVEVRLETSYVEVSHATDLLESGKTAISEVVIELRERAIRDDGTMQIKIASPGNGSSGSYSREVLERDIPRVFPKGTHMFADHETETERMERPERSIKDLAAVFVTDPVYLSESDGPDGEGSYVDVKPFQEYAPSLEDKALHIGTSINGSGTAIDHTDGRREITSIQEGRSVDFVTKAGRDGKIISLKESARVAQGNKTPVEPQESTLNASEETQLRESARTATEENTTLKRQLLESQLAPKVAEFVKTELAPFELPEAAHAKLTESLVKAPVLKDGAIDADAYRTAITEAAKSELEYAQKAFGFGTGEVQGANSATNEKKPLAPVMESVRAARASAGLV